VTHDAGGHEWQTRYGHHNTLFRGCFSDSRADTLKGSYYANPVIDAPSVHPNIREAYPEYHGTNICQSHVLSRNWCLILSAVGPKDEKSIEGFEPAFKELGSCVLFGPPAYSPQPTPTVLFTASFLTLVSNSRQLASPSPPHT
jgi:hypothetical protein